MENNILDEIEDTIQERIEIGGTPVYATKSFNQFLVSLITFGLMSLSQMFPFDFLENPEYSILSYFLA